MCVFFWIEEDRIHPSLSPFLFPFRLVRKGFSAHSDLKHPDLPSPPFLFLSPRIQLIRASMEEQGQIAPLSCTRGEAVVEEGKGWDDSSGSGERCGFCAICLEKIALPEMALVKGCEHAYCVMCILRWATYRERPSCPQCKHPFEFLSVHRSLDGSIQDYMFEESVCLLLRASWFVPLAVQAQREEVQEDGFDELEDFLQNEYEDELDDLDESYFASRSSIRIGNRRWGDNGYVRAGRKEARPVNLQSFDDEDAGPSRTPKKEAAKDSTGRRAKRALKREAADKAAAAKHQQHLQRLGRK